MWFNPVNGSKNKIAAENIRLELNNSLKNKLFQNTSLLSFFQSFYIFYALPLCRQERGWGRMGVASGESKKTRRIKHFTILLGRKSLEHDFLLLLFPWALPCSYLIFFAFPDVSF